MKITWIGHSCFKVEEKGYAVIFDPYGNGRVPGLGNVKESADLVLISHDHSDHNALGNVNIRKGMENPFTVTAIPTYHDDRQGELRGSNTMHILEGYGVRLAHLGDIGCEFTSGQRQILSGLDVVMIPVGGFYTIDAKTAAELIMQINPRIVIPMHYRKGGFGFDVIGGVEEFLDRYDGEVVRCDGCSVEITADMRNQAIVLTPQNIQE